MVPSEEDNHAHRAYPRAEESRSRCKITESIGPERLDVKSGDLSRSGNKWGLFDVEARHNKQLMRFFSFRPDLEAEAVDALAQPWTNIRPYAFPPSILLGRCLQKIRQEGVREIVVIAPVWQGQPWFPPLIKSLIDRPALLSQTHNFLTNPAGDPHPLVVRNRLYLAAWRLSRVQSRIREFQEKLSKSYAPHGEEVRESLFFNLRKVESLV